MGFQKKVLINFLNKRNYPLIKMYSFYKKDIWGFIKMRRLYKYKRVVYSILKKKKKFYYKVLRLVYKGFYYHIKRYNYKANLFFVKKRLKLFYGNLKMVYLGKLGLSQKRKQNQIFLVNFFSILERRIDVILYRAFYIMQIRLGRRLVCLKYIILNNKLLLNPNLILNVGDIVHVNHYPYGSLFLYYLKGKIINNYYKRRFYLILFKNLVSKSYYVKYQRVKYFYTKFFHKFLKKYNVTANFFYFVAYIRDFFRSIFFRKIIYAKVLKKKKRYFNYYSFLNYCKYFKYLSYIKFFYFIRRQRKKKLFYYLKSILYLNNFSIFRLQLRRFLFLLRPKYLRTQRNLPVIRRLKRLFKRKKIRKWRISKFVFYFLFKLKNFSFFFFGTPDYLLCDYKTHTICVLKSPSIFSLKYPFSVNFKFFFYYLKLKSYF
jgi:ribosomal protein S4